MPYFIVGALILALVCYLIISRKYVDQNRDNSVREKEMISRTAGAESDAGQISQDAEDGSSRAAASEKNQKNQGQNPPAKEERAGKSGSKKNTAESEETAAAPSGTTRDAGRRTTKPCPVRTEKEEAASEIYDCINKGLRQASVCWERGELDQLKELGSLSLSVRKYYDEILQGLRDDQRELLIHYREAVDLEEREDRLFVSLKEDADSEQLLFDSMMPFYPYYGKDLQAQGIRYGSMLSREVLSLFHQLTGRKFRIGFHRRYRSGVDSFDWKDNHYQVRDPEGRLYCDADFVDGKLVSGYARMPADQGSDEDWKVFKAGIFADGRLKDGTICYQYQKKIR